MRCGNLTCTGKPFTEHRNIPDLRPDPADPRLEWQQAADRVRAASVVLPVPPIPNTTIPDGPGPIRSAGQRRCSPPPDEVPVFPSIQARDLWPDGPGATGALRSGSRTGTDPTAAKMVTAHSPSLASSLSGGRGGWHDDALATGGGQYRTGANETETEPKTRRASGSRIPGGRSEGFGPHATAGDHGAADGIALRQRDRVARVPPSSAAASPAGPAPITTS
jgi:hypothetical protein